ncbi:hypothetical protein SAMN05660226_03879 [Parapedobacter luteus]|uniref:Uncharacterized protein n=1 Tax=Parapedobacter luteus TaxID=623280 RepID=A0A1T5FAQ1_9SPHI|nr:hypothetical protein [Parapedobacter luteus]SKB93206.1 hypothetical protein SAMN05660226_03879 [Parapedobacter luteus]
MNIKRIFGTVLTVLGIGGLIYTGVMVVQQSNQVRELIVVGILGLIFFSSGISLIRNTKDKE